MRACISVVLLGSLAGLHWGDAAEPCSDKGSGPMRDQILNRFRSHFTDFDKGYFEMPHRRQPGDQLVMISKVDTYCGGQALPSYYMEYTVKGARPVDVFNVLADTVSQPKWLCHGCTIAMLKNDLEEKVQGFSAAYRAPMVNRREFYQWQAYDANFSGQEFLVGAVARHTELLHSLRPPEPDATVGRMCYSFSRIRSHPEGAHVVQYSHFDARVPFTGPFITLRSLYHMVWPSILQRVPGIIKQSKLHAQKKWNANRIIVPGVFIGLQPSGASASELERVAMPKVAVEGGGYTAPKKSKLSLVLKLVGAALLVICCCGLLCGFGMSRGLCASCCSGGASMDTPWCDAEEESEESESETEQE